VEVGRDMVSVEAWAECGMVEGLDGQRIWTAGVFVVWEGSRGFFETGSRQALDQRPWEMAKVRRATRRPAHSVRQPGFGLVRRRIRGCVGEARGRIAISTGGVGEDVGAGNQSGDAGMRWCK